MDHSVKAMTPHRKVAFSRLCHRHRFENDELESLYRRYSLKLQQASVGAASALLLALTLILAALHVTYAQQAAPAPILLLALAVILAALLVLLNTRLMRHTYILPTCYLLLVIGGALVGVVMPLHNTWGWLGWQHVPNPGQGMWHVVFVSFVVYALMPVTTPIAVLYGLALIALQSTLALTIATPFSNVYWQQVSLQLLLFLYETF